MLDERNFEEVSQFHDEQSWETSPFGPWPQEELQWFRYSNVPWPSTMIILYISQGFFTFQHLKPSRSRLQPQCWLVAHVALLLFPGAWKAWRCISVRWTSTTISAMNRGPKGRWRILVLKRTWDDWNNASMQCKIQTIFCFMISCFSGWSYNILPSQVVHRCREAHERCHIRVPYSVSTESIHKLGMMWTPYSCSNDQGCNSLMLQVCKGHGIWNQDQDYVLKCYFWCCFLVIRMDSIP